MVKALVALLAAGCGRVGFAERTAGDAGAASDATTASDADGDGAVATVALLAHTIENGQVANLTTAPIDTTGASLIVVAECTWATGAPKLPTDSAGNAWQSTQSFGANQAPANFALFYALAPLTSTAHAFTNPGNDYLSIAVLAFSGLATFDTLVGGTGVVPFAPGAIVPSGPGEVLVSLACSGDSVATSVVIDAGFMLVDALLNTGGASSPEDRASAHVFETSASSFSPHWTFTGDAKATGALAAFGR